jgi:hypothetical protein
MNMKLFTVKSLLLSGIFGVAAFLTMGPEEIQETPINVREHPSSSLHHGDVIKPTQSFLEIIFSQH